MKRDLFLLMTLLVFFSCTKDDDKCIENKVAYVTGINAPETGAINEFISIDVYFGVNSGCGQFGRFIESGVEKSKTIVVEARYEGCSCTMDAPERLTSYEFKPNEAGTYELNFKSSESGFITVNILVE